MKALSMSELAILYFPHSSVKSASVQLKRWITYNRALQEELNATGYRNGQRILTPKQVDLIIHYLGEPQSSIRLP